MFFFSLRVESGPAGALSLQERVRMSDLILTCTVIQTEKSEGNTKGLGNRIAECEVDEIFKGDFEEENIFIYFLMIQRRKKAIRLTQGRRYILFLKKVGENYRMISHYQGGFSSAYEAVVTDEEKGRVTMGFETLVERVREITEAE